MENRVTYLFVLMARFIVVGLFSFIYVTPLYVLFYLIIFQNVELLNEISVKYYAIAYCVGFCLMYFNTMDKVEKDKKPVNKGL
jgi:hypothetical protein